MQKLKKISAALAGHTPSFVTIVAVAAYFMPSLFGWVRGYTQTAVLGVIMLTMGMTLARDDFRILVSRPFDIAVGTLAQFLIMPLVAWSIVTAFRLPREVAVGLILVGCCPGGVSSNIMSFLCKGDVAFSVGITTLSTVTSPIVTPLCMLWLAGETVDVDAAGMFKSILLVTLIPVGVGFGANAVLGEKEGFREFKKLLPGAAVIGLACIVGGVVSAHGGAIVKSGLMIFAAVFAHNTLGYVIGYLTGVAAKFGMAKRRTISIEVGMQNAGLATVLAGRHFPMMPEAAIASAVSCIWHSISGAMLADIFNRIDRMRND